MTAYSSPIYIDFPGIKSSALENLSVLDRIVLFLVADVRSPRIKSIVIV